MASVLKMIHLLDIFIIIFGIWACQVACGTLPETSILERHEKWMAVHGRVYNSEAEKEMRLNIFMENVERIESLNSAGNLSYKLGINQFADRTTKYIGYQSRGCNAFYRCNQGGPSYDPPRRQNPFKYKNVSEVPSSIDWRTKGAVTSVMDQKDCNSCWAFSAAAAMEGIIQIKTGKLISLSAQELVDCGARNGNSRCEAGYMDDAFAYIKRIGGLSSESIYPYKGVPGTCHSTKPASGVTHITGYENVPPNSEEDLLKAVANQPVSVTLDKSDEDFLNYSNSSGVYSGEKCGTDLNHAATVVGYGETKDGIKYWIIKNSWGTGWGEGGYARMKRGVHSPEGICGIAMRASYPIA